MPLPLVAVGTSHAASELAVQSQSEGVAEMASVRVAPAATAMDGEVVFATDEVQETPACVTV